MEELATILKAFQSFSNSEAVPYFYPFILETGIYL
jgi:hypothetical protein